ncbi:MAG: GNAT family N-acetyltransferase [bacterium]|nr:GNAT family N-acetyltransferase [bacterium]
MIRQIDALPIDIDALVSAADAEGLGMVDQLVTDFVSGANRFDQLGEGLWVAEEHHRLIGVCGLNQDPFARSEENAGRVRRLYVIPQWRKKGAASQLADAVELHARKHFALLTAFTSDPAARAFYEARGYETVVGVNKRSFQLCLNQL